MMTSGRSGAARWVWRTAILAALIAAMAALATPASARRVLPSTRSGIHQFTGIQARISHNFTASELTTIGRTSDIVTGLAVQIHRYGPRMRHANRRLRMFVYVNGMFAQSDQGSAFPNGWYLHDAGGHKITSGTHGNYLMNPFSRKRSHGVRGWAAYVTHQCVVKRREARFARGCFLDQMSSAGNTGFVSARPINPRTHRPFTMRGFMGAVNRVGNAAARRMPIIGNSYESGARYIKNSTRRVNRSHMRAFEAEHWLGATQPRDAQTLKTWKQNVQMLMSAQRHHKGVLVGFGDMASNLPQWQAYVVASMLLGNNGHVWVHFDAPGNGPASWQLNTPLMRAHIGRPLRTARKVGGYLKHGVYRRAFSKGLVIVNPTSRTVAVHLRRPARLTSGRRVTRVTAAPFSGVVLTR
jgi:hypothetical protein